MVDKEKQHFVDCNKVCNFHEGNSTRLTTIEASAKTTLAILVIVGGIITAVLGYNFVGQAHDIEKLEKNQTEHERAVASEVGKAVQEVRQLKWELRSEMNELQREQSKITGSNERIIKYLEAIMHGNGVELKPQDKLQDEY